ncbi:MAG: hypothetical protein HOY79_39220 [Streptomyces sp.]|nr:hypothetical protein [Streptomyces sp.]
MADPNTIEIVIKVRDQGVDASHVSALSRAVTSPALAGLAATFAELTAQSTKNLAAALIDMMPKLDLADTLAAALPKLDFVDSIADTLVAAMPKLDLVAPLADTVLTAIPNLGQQTGILDALSKPLLQNPIISSGLSETLLGTVSALLPDYSGLVETLCGAEAVKAAMFDSGLGNALDSKWLAPRPDIARSMEGIAGAITPQLFGSGCAASGLAKLAAGWSSSLGMPNALRDVAAAAFRSLADDSALWERLSRLARDRKTARKLRARILAKVAQVVAAFNEFLEDVGLVVVVVVRFAPCAADISRTAALALARVVPPRASPGRLIAASPRRPGAPHFTSHARFLTACEAA